MSDTIIINYQTDEGLTINIDDNDDVIVNIIDEPDIIVNLCDDLGTTANNYDYLDNKPSINNVELVGNKTLDDLGIEPKKNINDSYVNFPEIPTNNKFLRDDKTFDEIALKHSQLISPNEDVNVQHLTNAEKTQGALATGNTVLPTVKDVADNLELIVTNFTISLNFVEPYSSDFFNEVDFKIVIIETNPTQSITILVNNVAYTIGNTISKFDKVTITPLLTGYVILNCEVV